MKRAAEGAKNSLYVETGDSLVDTDARRKAALTAQTGKKAEVVADFFRAIPPAAITIGESDFTIGAEHALDLLTSRGFRPHLTNLRRKDEPAPRATVSEVAGYRFLSVTLFGRKAAAAGFEWSDPMATLDAARAEAGEVGVVLVTVHQMDEATSRRIAERGDFLKILIDPDGARRLKPMSRTTRTLVVAPPAKGTDLLVVDLHLKKGAPAWYLTKRFEMAARGSGASEGLGTLQEEGEAARECHLSRTEVWRLDGSFKDDPAVAQLMAEYKKWTKTAGLAAAQAAQDTNAPPYMGAGACAGCHQEQYDNWLSSRHAHAWEALEKDPDGGAEDPECISCHVSGFLQPGGPSRMEDLERFRNVQCESCHLPVDGHPGGGRRAKVSEELCRTCHSETRDPYFDYAKYLPYATCLKRQEPGKDRPPR